MGPRASQRQRVCDFFILWAILHDVNRSTDVSSKFASVNHTLDDGKNAAVIIDILLTESSDGEDKKHELSFKSPSKKKAKNS